MLLPLTLPCRNERHHDIATIVCTTYQLVGLETFSFLWNISKGTILTLPCGSELSWEPLNSANALGPVILEPWQCYVCLIMSLLLIFSVSLFEPQSLNIYSSAVTQKGVPLKQIVLWGFLYGYHDFLIPTLSLLHGSRLGSSGTLSVYWLFSKTLVLGQMFPEFTFDSMTLNYLSLKILFVFCFVFTS